MCARALSGAFGLKLDGSRVRRIGYFGLALGLLLAFLSLLDLVHPKVYFAVKRVSIWEYFTLRWEPLPYLLALSTVPLLISYDRRLALGSLLVLFGMIFFGYSTQLLVSLVWLALVVAIAYKRVRWGETLSYLFLIVLTITGVVFAYLLLFPALPWSIPILDDAALTWMKLYATLQPLGMLSYVLIPIGLLIPFYIEMIREGNLSDVLSRLNAKTRIQEFLDGRSTMILLVSSLVLSAYLSIYGYFPKLNPELKPTGVDIAYFYLPALSALMKSNDPVRFSFVNLSDRPLFYLFLYGVRSATHLPTLFILEFMPAFLLPALVASYYYVSLKLLNSRSMASLVALMTVAGIQTTVGLYSSFQANMIALILANALVGVALFWRGSTMKYITVGSLSFIIPFIHPYTSLYYCAILAVVLLVEAWRKRKLDYVLTMSVLVVSAYLSSPVTSYMASGKNVPPMGSAVRVAGGMIKPDNLFSFAKDTVYLFTTFYSGFIANSIYFALALLGLTRVLRLELTETAEAFLVASALTLLPIPLVSYSLASRLLFNAPLQIYAAIGARSIKWKILSVSLVALSLSYALQSVSNLGFLSISHVYL